MKAKYIDEQFRSYFEFGRTPDGKVSLDDGTRDICTVSHDEAVTLIKDRDEVLKLIHLFNELYPSEFEACMRVFH